MDNLTAESFFTTSKFSTLSRGDRSKSAFDRLRQGNGVNVNKPDEIKNIQKQIVQLVFLNIFCIKEPKYYFLFIFYSQFQKILYFRNLN